MYNDDHQHKNNTLQQCFQPSDGKHQKWLAWALLLMVLLLSSLQTKARERADTALMRRMFQYASTVDTAGLHGYSTHVYTRFYISIDRRNPMLMLVPSLYVIAHGKERQFISEAYAQQTFLYPKSNTKVLLRITTIPHGKHTLDRMLQYLSPNIYATTIIDDYLLSPFHADNHRFYKYKVTFLLDGTAKITFRPRRRNTQLLKGYAIVDYYSGRVISCKLAGEYDLINFDLNITTGTNGITTLLPRQCEAVTKFSLLGNKVTAHSKAIYGLPEIVDSIDTKNEYAIMNRLRPDSLDSLEQDVVNKQYRRQYKQDSTALSHVGKDKKPNFVKDVLWDIIGNNALNRINSTFGANNQGYIRLNPVLNPLYMSYDHTRGFTYKIDLRSSYQFTENKEISLRLQAGYAFKQHQFYWKLPVFYYFNKSKNAYIKLEVGNGNHIQSSSIRDEVEHELPDTLGRERLLEQLNEFKQTYCKSMVNYEINNFWGVQAGLLYQQRVALHRHAFRELSRPDIYRSFAPLLQIQYRPIGWSGPILTIDYDRSIKGVFHSNTGYERWEMNTEYIYRLNRLQSWQGRFGLGFYSHKDSRTYFLNYENFSENNLPGGWNDDWSGQFELLNSRTYNNSTYYIRTNITYESPLLLLSWLPWLGHYMEMERIYVSALEARHVHPYLEVGYGFTTRLLSIGIFASNGRGNRSFGCKFGFELFRHW